MVELHSSKLPSFEPVHFGEPAMIQARTITKRQVRRSALFSRTNAFRSGCLNPSLSQGRAVPAFNLIQ